MPLSAERSAHPAVLISIGRVAKRPSRLPQEARLSVYTGLGERIPAACPRGHVADDGLRARASAREFEPNAQVLEICYTPVTDQPTEPLEVDLEPLGTYWSHARGLSLDDSVRNMTLLLLLDRPPEPPCEAFVSGQVEHE